MTPARDARRPFARPETLRAGSVAGTQKIHNLDANGYCVMRDEAEDLPPDRRRRGSRCPRRSALRRHPKLSRSVSRRHAEVVGDRLDAEFVASASRGARFSVYEITPMTAFSRSTASQRHRW
jgi:hypothetical protein